MKNITVLAKIENLDSVKDFISSSLKSCGFDNRNILQMEVASEEIFVNICRYAYLDKEGEVSVSFVMDEIQNTADIKFIDTGYPFNPLLKEQPNFSIPLHEREEGGLGIFLATKMVSSLDYIRENEQNILIVRKNKSKGENISEN